MDEIERLRGTVAHETMRASFLRDKTTAYEELDYISQGGDEDSHSAFAIAERAKSRALVDLLTGVVQGSATLADDAVEGRIRDLQSDLNVTYGRMFGGTDDDGHGTPSQICGGAPSSSKGRSASCACALLQRQIYSRLQRRRIA